MTKEIALHREQGQSIWMVGALMTFKATAAETDGAFTLVEAQNAPGGGAPPHVHHNEDEFFYVINGGEEVQRRFSRPGERLSASIAKPRGGLWPAPTLSGSEAAAAQVTGGAAVFGQHPPLAAVTTREVGIICRRLGC